MFIKQHFHCRSFFLWKKSKARVKWTEIRCWVWGKCKGQNGHTPEWTKKERIDDPGFFSAGFLSNGVLFFFFFNGITFSSSVSDSVNRSTILTKTFSWNLELPKMLHPPLDWERRGLGPRSACVPPPPTPDQLSTSLFSAVNLGHDNHPAVFNVVGQGQGKATALQRTRAPLLRRCSDKLFHPVGFLGDCTPPMAFFKTFFLLWVPDPNRHSQCTVEQDASQTRQRLYRNTPN